MDGIFLATISDYIQNFANDRETNYLRFERLPIKLRTRRHGFFVTVHKDYLYIIGGWRRGNKYDVDRADCSDADGASNCNDSFYFAQSDLITMTVKTIERISIQSIMSK